jgi:hypothetical protein
MKIIIQPSAGQVHEFLLFLNKLYKILVLNDNKCYNHIQIQIVNTL